MTVIKNRDNGGKLGEYMKKNIEEIIKEYENNINNARKYNSYINEVREYNGYIFKEINDLRKFKNESQWLKELRKRV